MPEFQQLQFGFSVPSKSVPGSLPKRPAPAVEGPTKSDPPRENYPHAEGQQVMGVHDLGVQHELDRHGNVFDPSLNQNWFNKHTAGMSNNNESLWQRHAETRRIRIDSVLHTGQSAASTGGHAYIHGPLVNSHTDIAIEGGVPNIADGHHRLAEARGRGETHFSARVRDLDAERATHPTIQTYKKKDLDGIRQHLLDHHGVFPRGGKVNLELDDLAQRHAVLHRQEYAEHNHS